MTREMERGREEIHSTKSKESQRRYRMPKMKAKKLVMARTKEVMLKTVGKI